MQQHTLLQPDLAIRVAAGQGTAFPCHHRPPALPPPNLRYSSAPGMEPVDDRAVHCGQEALGAHAEGVAHRGAGQDDVQVVHHLGGDRRGRERAVRSLAGKRSTMWGQQLRSRQQVSLPSAYSHPIWLPLAPSQIRPPQRTRWMKKRHTLSLVSTRPAALADARRPLTISSLSSAVYRSAGVWQQQGRGRYGWEGEAPPRLPHASTPAWHAPLPPPHGPPALQIDA